MPRALLVALLLLLSGCTGAKDGPEPTVDPDVPIFLPPLDELRWTGRECAELGLFVRAPAANVRPHVHENFTLFVTQGQATLAIGVSRCTAATILENTTNNIVMSDVAVFVEDPEGGRAPAFYHLWQASNRHATVENMSRVGLATKFAPHSNFLTFGLVQATLAESRIAAEDGAYLARGTSPNPPGGVAAPAQTYRWWHASDNGTMYTDLTLLLRSQSAATGNLTFAPGSPWAAMVGDTEARGDGVYWTFDLTVHARRI